MAVDVTRTPWEFTAASDAHNFPMNNGDFVRIRIDTIVIVSGATGGVVTVLDESGGRELVGPIVMAVSDREQIVVNDYIKGIFISTLPATCIVYVYPSPEAPS